MSSYAPINDHLETTHKTEHASTNDSFNEGSQSHRYSSHPYSKSQSQGRPASEAIEVMPAADGVSGSAYGYGTGPTAGPSTFNSQDGGQRISRYETSLSLRYDVEAAMAYVLGMFSGALLLVLEKKNDYVRFHAWQSSLLSAAAFVVLFLTALISNLLYWLTLLATIAALGYMARRAFLDGAVFERYALPYVGPLAIQFVDEE
ncbi:hypothetical protein H4R20_003479 [Coemansia guatemalensis]|uniref:Uncharacterized protein n=1 Tax=Coemansia guatemalensis TaxID=2761395 RepID=A0A9W8HT81_9FUNG|nr:hypothetical protein H4R20_003479 [Coemansia guatemalensis]